MKLKQMDLTCTFEGHCAISNTYSRSKNLFLPLKAKLLSLINLMLVNMFHAFVCVYLYK